MNTDGVTVNRGEIVSMYAGLKIMTSSVCGSRGLEALYFSGWRAPSLCNHFFYSMVLSIVLYHARILL